MSRRVAPNGLPAVLAQDCPDREKCVVFPGAPQEGLGQPLGGSIPGSIHNHLKSRVMILRVTGGTIEKPTFEGVARIDGGGTTDRPVVFRAGIEYQIHVAVPDGGPTDGTIDPTPGFHWERYQVITPSRDMAGMHLGQVTTRLSQNDSLPMKSTTQGMPAIRIRNGSDLCLRLNESIVVPPHSIFYYRGRYSYGVPLGSFFVDLDGRYPDVQINRSINDLYYGVISSTEEPVYGGLSLTNNADLYALPMPTPIRDTPPSVAAGSPSPAEFPTYKFDEDKLNTHLLKGLLERDGLIPIEPAIPPPPAITPQTFTGQYRPFGFDRVQRFGP